MQNVHKTGSVMNVVPQVSVWGGLGDFIENRYFKNDMKYWKFYERV